MAPAGCVNHIYTKATKIQDELTRDVKQFVGHKAHLVNLLS